MSWSIAELVNNVEITPECAKELFKGQGYKGEIWDDAGEVTNGGKLYFNPDHMEHMDYIGRNKFVVKTLNKYKAKGDICFGSVEGDDAGSFWGYRFDGKGKMACLEGRLHWQVK